MWDRERALRIEVGYVGTAEPAIAYWALYTTDERGQWALSADYCFDPFDASAQGLEFLAQIVSGWFDTL